MASNGGFDYGCFVFWEGDIAEVAFPVTLLETSFLLNGNASEKVGALVWDYLGSILDIFSVSIFIIIKYNCMTLSLCGIMSESRYIVG